MKGKPSRSMSCNRDDFYQVSNLSDDKATEDCKPLGVGLARS